MLALLRSTRLQSGRRSFTTSVVSGITTAIRPSNGPISEVSVIIKAGSRYENQPGLSHVLEKFAFRNTENKSALRLVRETELLGGCFETFHDRENIVLKAKFLKQNLPYFVKALGDTLQNTLFNKYELDEAVAPLAAKEAELARSDAGFLSQEAAYEAAFRSGLGNGLLVEPHSSVSIEQVKEFSQKAYTKANITLAGVAVEEKDFQALIDENFGSITNGEVLDIPSSIVHSGDVRIRSSGPSAVTIGFPTDKPSPIYYILAEILGGKTNVKWGNGSNVLSPVASKTGTTIETKYRPYSDAGILTVTIKGSTSDAVASATKAAAREIRELSGIIGFELIQHAINSARLRTSENTEGYSLTQLLQDTRAEAASVDEILKASSAISGSSIAVGAVGEIHKLPYGSDLFY